MQGAPAEELAVGVEGDWCAGLRAALAFSRLARSASTCSHNRPAISRKLLSKCQLIASLTENA